jgi:hypothetical protein
MVLILLFIFIFSDVTSERFSARFSLLLPLLSLAPLSTYLPVWYLSYVLPHHTFHPVDSIQIQPSEGSGLLKLKDDGDVVSPSLSSRLRHGQAAAAAARFFFFFFDIISSHGHRTNKAHSNIFAYDHEASTAIVFDGTYGWRNGNG